MHWLSYLRHASPKERKDLRARIRITSFAALDYGVAMAITAMYAWLGAASLQSLAILSALALLINACFLGVIASGRSLRYPDPALTGNQVAVAVVFNLTSMVLLPDMSLAVFIFVFVGLSYGALNMPFATFLRIWLLYVIGFSGILAATDIRLTVPLETTADRAAILVAVLLVMGRFLWITAFASHQRERLRTQKHELVRSADALEQSRRQLMLILETLPVGVIVYEERGEVKMRNHVASASLRALFAQETEDAWAQLRAWVERSLLGGGGIAGAQGLESEVAGVSGRRFLVKVSHRESEGGGTERILVFWDVTHLRRAEQEREQALAFLSHDLRAPLSAISARLSNNRSDLNRERASIQADLRRSTSLVDDFVMLARTGRFDRRQLRSIDLVELVQEAVHSTEPLAVEAGVAMRLVCPSSPVLVEGDWVLLLRAMVNLIVNALKHSPESGQVELRVSRTPGHTSGAHAQIDVVDEGTGLPASVLTALRSSQALPLVPSNDRRSVGLGLLLVREVMVLHHGQLVLRNAPSGGAHVCLMLPPSAEASVRDVPTPSAGSPPADV